MREERERLAASGILRSLTERGIGGIADFTRLKCLHLHVAHALARENPIGDLVLRALAARTCGSGALLCAIPSSSER